MSEGICLRFGKIFFICLKRRHHKALPSLPLDVKRKVHPTATSSHSVAMKETRLKMRVIWPIIQQKRMPEIDDNTESMIEPREKSALLLLFRVCPLMHFLKKDTKILVAEHILVDLNPFFLIDQNETLDSVPPLISIHCKIKMKLSACHLNQNFIWCFSSFSKIRSSRHLYC